MKEYKFNDNTLLHSIGFNPYRLESILNNGILSYQTALEDNISFAKNYIGYNGDNYISMTRVLYSNKDDLESSYNKYVLNGISLIVEDQEFIFDKKDNYFNHADEVYVENKIDKDKIVGILVPIEYLNVNIKDVQIISKKATSYYNLKDNGEALIDYLKGYNYKIDKENYKEIISYMAYSLKAYQKEEDESLVQDFEEGKEEFAQFLSMEVANCFRKVLNKSEVTVSDLVTYINDKTLKLPVFYIEKRKKYHV